MSRPETEQDVRAERDRLRVALEKVERKTRAGSAARAVIINEIARAALTRAPDTASEGRSNV